MIGTTGLTLGIHPGGDAASNSGTVSIGLMIDDFEAAKKLLDANGIAGKSEIGGSGDYLYFNDPDGTVIYFVKPKWS